MTALELRIKNYVDARGPDRDIKAVINRLGEKFFDLRRAEALGYEASIRIEAADMAITLVELLAAKGDSLTAWMEINTSILERRLSGAMSSCYENINEEIGA